MRIVLDFKQVSSGAGNFTARLPKRLHNVKRLMVESYIADGIVVATTPYLIVELADIRFSSDAQGEVLFAGQDKTGATATQSFSVNGLALPCGDGGVFTFDRPESRALFVSTQERGVDIDGFEVRVRGPNGASPGIERLVLFCVCDVDEDVPMRGVRAGLSEGSDYMVPDHGAPYTGRRSIFL